MEMSTALEIVDFMEGYNAHFAELRTFLAEKQEKVVADDLIWLLDSLTEEQKLIMRGNSMEAKRLALLESLGYGDMDSAALLEKFPEEYKGRFKAVMSRLEESVQLIKSTNETILDLIERKLEVQAAFFNSESVKGTDTYTNTGIRIHKNLGSYDSEVLGSV